MHKETCSEYLQLQDLANTSTPPGKKKRDCPIQEIDDDSDQDSDNSNRRRKLTKRVSVGIESAPYRATGPTWLACNMCPSVLLLR